MTKPTDFAVSLTAFLSDYLPYQLGASPNTILSYRDTFKLFLIFCRQEKGFKPEKLLIKNCQRRVIEEFLAWLEAARNCSVATRNQRLAALHAFFRYLQTEKPEYLLQFQEILALRTKKSPKATINYLSLDALKALFTHIDTDTINGRRDLVLLSVLYDTGARVQEIADLQVRDIRLLNPATIKLTGKGNKSRLVPLVPQTAKLLKAYLEERKLVRTESQDRPLFYNKMRSKLTRSGITYILDKYVVKARDSAPHLIPDKITPHCLRHSKAMHLLQAGVNLIYVRDFLGHADIQTTEIYARADSAVKRKALENAYQEVGQTTLPIWQQDTELLVWLQNLGKEY